MARSTLKRGLLFAVVFGVGLTACSDLEEDDYASDNQRSSIVETHSDNREHPPPNDIHADWDCELDADGDLRASGRLTNQSSETSVYDIRITFRDLDGRPIGEGAARVDAVGPGQSANWDTTVNVDVPVHPDCELRLVERVAA